MILGFIQLLYAVAVIVLSVYLTKWWRDRHTYITNNLLQSYFNTWLGAAMISVLVCAIPFLPIFWVYNFFAGDSSSDDYKTHTNKTVITETKKDNSSKNNDKIINQNIEETQNNELQVAEKKTENKVVNNTEVGQVTHKKGYTIEFTPTGESNKLQVDFFKPSGTENYIMVFYDNYFVVTKCWGNADKSEIGVKQYYKDNSGTNKVKEAALAKGWLKL